MELRYVLLLVILTGIYSCKENEIANPNLNGVWNTIGYGKQFIVTDSTVIIYDIYKGGCSFNSQFTREVFEHRFNITGLTRDSLTIRYGITDYHLVHPDPEPEICGEHSKNNNPFTNFEAFWNTFNENYVSFNRREIDWQQSRVKYLSKLNSRSSDMELYMVLSEMTSELNDEHVSIPIPESLADKIAQDNNNPSELRDSVIKAINAKHVDRLKTYNKGVVNWGIINGSIAYIQINAFADLANYSIDEKLSKNEFWEAYRKKAEESNALRKDILNGVKGLMPKLFEDIKPTKSCIIDVRLNGGGFDEAALEVLRYFIKKKTTVFFKKARLGNGFTKSQTISIEPIGPYYDGNVFILTSFQSASAAEIFVLASKNLPNVKIIGSNTMGIFSDILGKRLPNGWTYGLSTEIYESVNGINYERYGIPTDYDLNYEKDAEKFYNNLILELKKEDRAIKKVMELNAENALNNGYK